MASLIIVAVRDRAADCYMNPFYVPALGLAIRSFQDEINRDDSPMHGHPDDYDLYVMGSFDADTGKFTCGEDMPKQIAIGKQLIAHKVKAHG